MKEININTGFITTDTHIFDTKSLLISSEKESGYWLQAIPSQNVGTLLDNESFRMSVGLRLGTPGKKVDIFGTRGLSCIKSEGRISRHSSLNDTIKRALESIEIPAIIESTEIIQEDGKIPD